MNGNYQLPLKIVDAKELEEPFKTLLRAGELVTDREGRLRKLPRFFYRVDSWQTALTTRLTEHFSLWEFINIDIKEAEVIRTFPRYIPCAVSIMAAHLQLFRQAVGTYVRIATNGGYRSPAHALSNNISPHLWATAANIYRIGDEYLDKKEAIERYAEIAKRVIPGAWVRPYGFSPGQTNDHLHIDLGYVTVLPNHFSEEEQ
jgi:hypothetical protein